MSCVIAALLFLLINAYFVYLSFAYNNCAKSRMEEDKIKYNERNPQRFTLLHEIPLRTFPDSPSCGLLSELCGSRNTKF